MQLVGLPVWFIHDKKRGVTRMANPKRRVRHAFSPVTPSAPDWKWVWKLMLGEMVLRPLLRRLAEAFWTMTD